MNDLEVNYLGTGWLKEENGLGRWWTLSQTMIGRFLWVVIIQGRYLGCIMKSRGT
ncbi:MAG: hypothetical protein P1P69_02890 [Methanosarcinaceae archaeon]|nr:hypothetical protein [Methanosarcinaceae archaeon]MDF1533433.1 hypothetical protein [Methanosarcinaceae archaeon]